MRFIVFAFLLAILAAPATASEGGCSSSGLGPMISDLGRKTNETRAAAGQQQLPIDGQLNLAAQRHACDLARRQVVSHRDNRGRRPMARIKNAGFAACFSAENVAMGTRTPDVTVSAWQKSAGHARNQQDPRARAMGFGIARGGDGRLYWVAVYAARCDRQVAAGTGGLRPFRW